MLMRIIEINRILKRICVSLKVWVKLFLQYKFKSFHKFKQRPHTHRPTENIQELSHSKLIVKMKYIAYKGF